METSDNSKILFMICSFVAVFTFLAFIPDEDDDLHQVDDAGEIGIEKEELEKELLIIDKQQTQQTQVNNNNNNNENIGLWRRFLNYFKTSSPSSKDQQISPNSTTTPPSIESFSTTTTTTTTTTSISISRMNELKEELEQEIIGKDLERKGRLLAENKLLDSLSINKVLSKKLDDSDEYSQKLLSLCTLAINKKKSSQLLLMNLTDQTSNLLSLISNNSTKDNNNFNIKFDENIIEQLEQLSKSIKDIQSTVACNINDSLHSDESIFLDIIKHSQQKLPFTFSDISS